YLLLAVGGVIGGSFNAFLAPLIFAKGVWEFPIVLALACLARTWGPDDFKRWEWVAISVATVFFLLILGLAIFDESLPMSIRMWHWRGWTFGPYAAPLVGVVGPISFDLVKLLLIPAVIGTFLIRDRGLIFAVLIGALMVAPKLAGGTENIVLQDRSFFGVLRVTQQPVQGFASVAHALANGTTLHGAQSRDPETACQPLTYYALPTPIGQVFHTREVEKPAINIGAVGMGAGTVASFVRSTDTLRFYEIDKHVIKLSTNPANFSYINGCAKGKIDWKLGDARVSLEKEPSNSYDILLVDAFSSDAVPAHLLTVEAMRTYLRVVKPDGVVIMHLSNRHLALAPAVAAVAKAAGGYGLYQYHYPAPEAPEFTDTGEEAVIVGRNAAALADFAALPLWSPSDPQIRGAKPWTDDYSNLFGALVRGTAQQSGPMSAIAQAMLGKNRYPD
ncbi:MAG: fused MFS/spermidine synthase, partial [Alphaproteobacteria bacterium]